MSKTDSSPFGSIAIDDNNKAIQTGSSFVVADATGTPQTSPLSYTTGVTTIIVPDGAIEFIAAPSTDLRVAPAVAVTTYDVVKASTKESIPCARMQNIYIRADSTSGTLNFRFTVV